MNENYFIGLDIGTDSIGWAVTDLEYRLIKKGGRDFWGVYLFDEAKTAAERRGYRTARRRTARTHHRLMLLQELFAEEIVKIDPTFFLRLQNSALHLIDKDNRLKGKDVLFAGEGFKDKEYHKKFPTIYHLRAHLLENEAEDIRFLYLALHHIVKNRGHFLFEAQNFNAQDTQNIVAIFGEMNTYLFENEYDSFETQNLANALNIIKDKNIGILDKSKKLKNVFCVEKNKQLEAAIKAMVGGKVKLRALYPNLDVEVEDMDVCFAKETFDEEVLPNIESQVGDDVSFIKNLKAVYDWSVLSAILGEEKFISAAKIKIYEKHKADLKRLKELVRAQDSDGRLYRKVFKKQDKVNNYAAYIGMDAQKGFGKCNKKDFYDFLKKTVNLDDYIKQEIENENFLPKQVSNANGVIPYQVHLTELQQILERSMEKYPFLKKVEEGTTVAEKIQSLMTFRIPYFVGPLHTASPFAWAKRNDGYENISITPWNFDKAIDKDASEEEFIRRMTNKCTYLIGEDVLPASSLIYSEFAFLNELNNLKVNGQYSTEAKQAIYEYARAHKKVTLSACLKLLKEGGMVEKNAKKEEVFSGVDEFHTSMSSYVALKEILGETVDLEPQFCEEIIERITITEDKSRLEQILKAKYGKKLTDEQIKRLKSLNYMKWGRLSGKLLTNFYVANCCNEGGELLSILDVMRQTNKNFMQVLHEYGFEKAINEYNDELTPTNNITYKTVEDLYCSPSVKRAIWRTLDLVKEIVKVMGGEPKKIFVEMAREKEDNGKKGKRTTSRKQQLLDLYAFIKDEERNWREEIEKTEDTKFNSKKLVLYYMQQGICMYSGKKIPLEYVFNTNICDIEHIYPRSKLKDDSFDNTILVYKKENAKKEDVYPIDGEIQSRMGAFWLQLKSKGFISEKKYERLIRKKALTQDELTDFINRQLVETRQSTKEVAGLLRKMFAGTEVVYAKAGNADDFKHEFGLVKVRELNDLHHAKDAFVNIVVGNVYNTKFNHNAKIYFKNNGLDSYNIKYLYTKDIPNAWSVEDKEEIFKTYRKNTCRVVRFTSNGTGKLFEVNPVSGKDRLIPLKRKKVFQDTKRYGGYEGVRTTYFMLIKGRTKNDDKVLSFEPVSLYQEATYKKQADKENDVCQKSGLRDCEVVLKHIKLNTLISVNGSYAYICGITSAGLDICNANQLILPEEQLTYFKKISNFFRNKKKYPKGELSINKDISAEENQKLYDLLAEKLSSPVYAGLNISGQAKTLKQQREKFLSLPLEQQLVVLFEIVKLMNCKNVTANFQDIGKGATVGKAYMSKQIQDKQVKIILQSPTGHYRKIINCADFL